jgi:hypothetical protein
MLCLRDRTNFVNKICFDVGDEKKDKRLTPFFCSPNRGVSMRRFCLSRWRKKESKKLPTNWLKTTIWQDQFFLFISSLKVMEQKKYFCKENKWCQIVTKQQWKWSSCVCSERVQEKVSEWPNEESWPGSKKNTQT